MIRYMAHRARNLVHSTVLIAGMSLMAALCGYLIFGPPGFIWAPLAAGSAAILAPLAPAEFVLSLYGARRLESWEFPEGYAIARELAGRAELPAVPALYYVPSSVLNAFTVGHRASASIALTDGMIRGLTLREFAGVMAHEISHIVNRDLWIMALADAMSRITALLSWFGMILLIVNLPLVLLGSAPVPWGLVFILLFAPTVMSLLQMALSRTREYEADLRAAALTGDPRGLASALARIERRQGRFWEEIFYAGRRIPDPSLLRTHPPTEERIDRLLQLEQAVDETDISGREAAELPPAVIKVRTPPRLRWWGGWY